MSAKARTSGKEGGPYWCTKNNNDNEDGGGGHVIAKYLPRDIINIKAVRCFDSVVFN